MTSSTSNQITADKPQTGALNGLRTVPLKAIKPRVNSSTRALKIEHVVSLAESIMQVGLICPIAIDNRGYLVAGAHRLAALGLLSQPVTLRSEMLRAIREKNTIQLSHQSERILISRIEALKVWTKQIPVNILAFDSRQRPQPSLVIEIAENEKRAQYNKDEIKGVIGMLEQAGYSLNLDKGRPSAGTLPGRPVLMKILGVKSLTTLRKLLSSVENDQIDHLDGVTPNLLSKDLATVLRAQQKLLIREDLPDRLRSQLQAVQDSVSVYARKIPSHINGTQTTAFHRERLPVAS